MSVRLTHIDGKLPNLALMKLAHWHRSQGDKVHFTRHIERELWEPNYDKVYASCIFTMSTKRLEAFQSQWPTAVVGGTGSLATLTTEEIIGRQYEHYDYTIYPDYQFSLGFTQRGCRLKCKFCVVPAKEGKPRSVNTIADIWRADTPRCLVLLDNDFFGQDEWRERLAEIHDGDFKVSFNQGINIRLITEEAAEALASVKYYDDGFKSRRLYTAWDNLKDERIFFRGVERLEKHGVPPHHLMVYMLVGFDPAETWERTHYRFNRMVELGIRPYPMVYDPTCKDLKRFQRWAVRRYYEVVAFEDFDDARSHGKASKRGHDDAPMFSEVT